MTDLEIMKRALKILRCPERPPQTTNGILSLPTGSSYVIRKSDRIEGGKYIDITLGSWPAKLYGLHFDAEGRYLRFQYHYDHYRIVPEEEW